jgi:outer membrane protein OmpA-like peptidoglycan-associated protein
MIVVGASLAALGLGLGGCQNKEQQMQLEQMAAQNAQLQQERDALATQVNDANSRAAQAEAARAAAEARIASNPPPAQPGWGTDSGTSRPMPKPDVVIAMAGDVSFSSGQAELTAAGKKELDGIARTITSRYADNFIRIEGYTDNTPIRKSKWGTNEALSQARAEAVMRYLSSKGISSSRMEAVGRGSANPKSTKAASRRVEIHILGS